MPKGIPNPKRRKQQAEIWEALKSPLLPYQIRYLTDPARYIVVEKSRRIGITWACALKHVVKRLTRKDPIDLLFSSADLKAAAEFLAYCRDWSQKFNDLLGYEAVPLADWTTEVGKFANGSRILILSSNPTSFRSKQGDVVLDEYAFHEQQEAIYTAAQPCMMWLADAQMELISTHSGPESPFHRICREAENGKSRFSWHRTTLFDAVNQGLSLKVWQGRIKAYTDKAGVFDRDRFDRDFIEDIKSGCVSDEAFEQEYCCCPAKYSTLIDAQMYEDCVLYRNGQPEVIPDQLDFQRAYGELFVGIDCGRVHDMTVIWVLEKLRDPRPETPEHLRDIYRTVCVNWMRNVPFGVQEQVILSIVRHPAVSRCLIDRGTIGAEMAERLADEMGSVVEPFTMTAPRMAMMAERLRAFVQQRRITLPAEPRIREDIMCVRKTVNAEGRKHYGGNTRESHGDSFWAAALALWSALDNGQVQLMTRNTPALPEAISA